MIETVALLLGHVAVFGGAWALGAPAGFIHPAAAPGRYLRAMAVTDAVLMTLAFLAALLGFGAVSWVLWVLAVAASLAQDVNAVVKRHQVAAVRRRFRQEKLT